MKRTQRRRQRGNEISRENPTKTVIDVRNESKSKEQMKRDWGSPRSTMNKKLGK